MKSLLPAIIAFLVMPAPALKATGALPDAATFFKESCIKCHGPKKQKSDMRLDTLTWDPATQANLERWRDIADTIASKQMPPDEEPQPSDTQREAIVATIENALKGANAQHRKEVVMRRLNRTQYRNTVEDLLGIGLLLDDPTSRFPGDDVLEGFDNVGEGLTTSAFLLRGYLEAAREIVDRSTFDGPKPEVRKWTLFQQFAKKEGRKGNWASGSPSELGYFNLIINDENGPGDPRGRSLTSSEAGAEHNGRYRFTFEVESKGRLGEHAERYSVQESDTMQKYYPEDLHRFEIYLTAPRDRSPQQTRQRFLMDSYDLHDDERKTIEVEYFMLKGWRVEVAFGNGRATSNRRILQLLNPDFDEEKFAKLQRRDQNVFKAKKYQEWSEQFDTPRIRVHQAVEEGPFYSSWPPVAHQRIYGKEGEAIESVIHRFAERAFRRPVTDEQVARYVRLAESSEEGIRTGIEAILCSPAFIYFTENPGPLDDYAFASRLSYFLWSTMPDDELMQLAAAGKLRSPGVLRSQAERLLADERSEAFVNDFTWGWLHLQNSVDMPPDGAKFVEFNRNSIHKHMVGETRAFFRDMLQNNFPLGNLLHSDYAFVNADMARHYGFPPVATTVAYQKVALKASSRRGGLLGQASVLTASANGVDTSPVVRGIWILEHLLGTPPNPPPPDVPIVEPDTRGDLTIREIYAKHRTVESCNSCHKKIDPLGFALENFDAVGQWRTQYESGNEVDSSGRMPGGEQFEDVTGLKKIMTQDLDQFTRNLTTKLLTYATGRAMDVADRPEIDRIVKEVTKENGGLRDLVLLVVQSPVFREK